MNKILNWTFGSIFRTIGRIIAYIFVGALAWFFISGLDLSDWRDKLIISPIQNWRWVSLPKVYASSYTTNVVYGSTGYLTQTDNVWTSDDVFYKRTITPSNTIQRYKLSFQPMSSNADYLEFNFLASQPNTSISTYQTSDDYCIEWKWKTITTNENVTEWYCSRYDTNTNDFKYARETTISGMNFYFYVDYTDGSWANCETIENNFAMCPTSGKNINGITALINYSNNNNSSFQFAFNRIVNYYILDNSTTNAINNQTQQQHQDSQQTTSAIESQTQQQHQDSQALNETITDDTPPDVSSALDNDTVAGWLPPGPIDSLVNLPLTLFNSLTNAMGGSCGALTVPLPFIDKNLSIPCMSNVYGSMGFSSFFNWIGVIASAFILFSYLMKLYKWVDDTLTFRENNHLDNWGGV